MPPVGFATDCDGHVSRGSGATRSWKWQLAGRPGPRPGRFSTGLRLRLVSGTQGPDRNPADTRRSICLRDGHFVMRPAPWVVREMMVSGRGGRSRRCASGRRHVAGSCSAVDINSVLSFEFSQFVDLFFLNLVKIVEICLLFVSHHRSIWSCTGCVLRAKLSSARQCRSCAMGK